MLTKLVFANTNLQVLQLLAGKQNPWTEQNIRRVAVDHREQDVVDLESEDAHVSDGRGDGERIPGLEWQPRDVHRHGLVGLVVPLQLCAVAEECNCCPEDSCGDCCAHDEQQQASHLWQSNLMISADGLMRTMEKVGFCNPSCSSFTGHRIQQKGGGCWTGSRCPTSGKYSPSSAPRRWTSLCNGWRKAPWWCWLAKSKRNFQNRENKN